MKMAPKRVLFGNGVVGVKLTKVVSLVLRWWISEPTKAISASFDFQRMPPVQYFACRCEWLGTYKRFLKMELTAQLSNRLYTRFGLIRNTVKI